MGIKVFTEMLKDKHFPDYKKLKYKYGADFNSFLKTLEELYYNHLPLYVPFSSKIEKSRKAYYDAYTIIEENRKISGKIDVTAFILYFINNVYNKMNEGSPAVETLTIYDDAVKDGKITEKETKLWKFVLSAYGTGEFSTKRLEKDFGDAAYATIRGFVLKFEQLGLLSSVKYGPRVKYKVVS